MELMNIFWVAKAEMYMSSNFEIEENWDVRIEKNIDHSFGKLSYAPPIYTSGKFEITKGIQKYKVAP